MSVATALMFALEPRGRFQKGFSDFPPFPSPTNTIAPVIQSITIVKNLFFLPTRLRCLHLNMKYPAFSPTGLMLVA
ncbi:MAG: hypothetical protein DWI22_18780 [Planctomycetota bacterium]|nr:MAG: hypothetical protein DWI22_18780 [Planctomycetota bacterium]